MTLFDPAYAPWLFGGVQILGLASALFARLSERSAVQSLCQWFFVLCLCLVGVATALALTTGPAYCLICGSTLSIMSVAAVCDFDPSASLDAF